MPADRGGPRLARWALAAALAGCGRPDAPLPTDGNILVVVLDDVGAYELRAYRRGETFHTPVIDALADEGLTFERAWSMPLCAPSRAAALTGRFPRRTGMGTNPEMNAAGVSLPDADLTWAEQLRATAPGRWRTAAIGKWHVSSWADGGGARVLAQGFDTYKGVLGNLYDGDSQDGQASSYEDFEKYYDVTPVRQQGYLTTDEIDDAILLARRLPEPWAMWVALHAAHEPFDDPPASVFPDGAPTPIEGTGLRQRYGHIVEAADAELGRLLAAVPDDTHVILIGDNGTPMRARPETRAALRLKGSVYEGGVRVPLIIRSPRVAHPGRSTEALASIADLFPTIVELAGGSVAGLDLDGRSLLPVLDDASAEVRDVVYTEQFEPNGPGPYTLRERAARDDTYKLIRTDGGDDALYRLRSDMIEGVNLLSQALSPGERAAYRRLSEVVEAP